MGHILKDCPFCGHEVEKYFNGDRDMASCPDCCQDWDLKSWQQRPIEDALTAELAALREAARWVKVGDRLPTPEQSVLMSNGNAVETGCYFAGNWWQNGSKVRVTHWRPLPTPPDEEA